jgi:hypothetical protein
LACIGFGFIARARHKKGLKSRALEEGKSARNTNSDRTHERQGPIAASPFLKTPLEVPIAFCDAKSMTSTRKCTLECSTSTPSGDDKNGDTFSSLGPVSLHVLGPLNPERNTLFLFKV